MDQEFRNKVLLAVHRLEEGVPLSTDLVRALLLYTTSLETAVEHLREENASLRRMVLTIPLPPVKYLQ